MTVGNVSTLHYDTYNLLVRSMSGCRPSYARLHSQARVGGLGAGALLGRVRCWRMRTDVHITSISQDPFISPVFTANVLSISLSQYADVNTGVARSAGDVFPACRTTSCMGMGWGGVGTYVRGEQIFQKSRSRLKILGARWVI
jgi:hypothetical protein